MMENLTDNDMKRILITVLSIAAAALPASCTKEVISTQGLRIGTKTVSAAAGNFSALVTTEGVWSASSPDSWIHLSSKYYKGECAISVSYDSNESTEAVHRFNRKGCVLISTYDKAVCDTIYVLQSGLEPLISLPAEFSAKSKGSYRVSLITNLSDNERPAVKCTVSSSCVSDVRWSADGEAIEFTRTEAASGDAVLTVAFTDAWGQTCSEKCKIIF